MGSMQLNTMQLKTNTTQWTYALVILARKTPYITIIGRLVSTLRALIQVSVPLHLQAFAIQTILATTALCL